MTSPLVAPAPARPPRRRRSPRAYLLIEALFGGAILAAVLASTFAVLTEQRADTTYATRKAQAMTLCHAKLEELGSVEGITPITQAPIAVDATPGACQPVPPATTCFPGMSWEWTITDQTAAYATRSPFGLDANIFEIIVTVHYPTRQGLKAITMTGLKGQG